MIKDEDLADEPDLDAVVRAVKREQAIRDAMARTGEGREIVAEMIDATDAMGQEAVLDLTDGEPTTLRAALRQYVESLDRYPNGVHTDTVAVELNAILAYPWSAEEERVQLHEQNHSLGLHVEHSDEDTIRITIGSSRWLVFTAHFDADLPRSTWAESVEQAARAVHRAVLTRVIADRDHHVNLNAGEASSLVAWAVNSRGGSWSPSVASRVSVDAVAGGGLMIRTRPYSWQYQVTEAQRHLLREQAPVQGRWNVTPVSLHGIRPHLPLTAEQIAERERAAQEMAKPISREQIDRALGEQP